MKNSKALQLASATHKLVAEIANRQGHNICWWLPELFGKLCELYGIQPTTPMRLPSEREFEGGCNLFRRELYVSQITIFVEAVDGFHYQNPILFKDDWYLCFGDTPEIVVRVFKRTTTSSGLTRAGKVLRQAGVKFKFPEYKSVTEEQRLFPPKWDKMFKVLSIPIELLGPIPVPQEYAAKVNSPSSDCTYYSWTMEFKTVDVADPFLPNGHANTRLCAFVMGEKYYMIESSERKKKELATALTKLLGKEFAEIAKSGNAVAKYGERMRLSK
jgi:hypothetical protein